MPIAFDTQLMPQTLPGRTVRATSINLRMVAADSHRVIAFALDADRSLTVWYSAQEGYVRWIPVPAIPGDSGPGQVIDFDVIGNVGDGRRDGTIDLVMLFHRDRDNARLLYYWPSIPAVTTPEGWRLLFATAEPLVFPHQHPLEVARLGLMPLPVRHVISGSYNTSQWWEMYRVGSDGSGRYCTALDLLHKPRFNTTGGPSSYLISAAVGQRVGQPLEDGALVATLTSRGHLVDLLLPENRPDMTEQWPVYEQNGSPGADNYWPDLRHIETRRDTHIDGASFLFTTERNFNRNQVVTLFEVIDHRLGTNLPVSLPDLRPAEGPIAIVPLDGERPRIGRFELMRPANAAPGSPMQLVLTTSPSLTDADVASVPLFDDVATFCACRCGDPRVEPTALHVLVGYADGGIELFTQDSVSSQWQRFRVTDDDLREGWHTVNSYSTRIQVLNERGSPQVGAAVVLRPRAPCFALINGVATHLTPLIGQVATTDSGGAVNLVQPVSSLGATLIDVDQPAPPALPDHPPGSVLSHAASQAWAMAPVIDTQTINPMDKAAARLASIQNGADLQAARASDGSHPFAHLPLDRCNEAGAALTRLMPAYQATLQAPITTAAPPTEVGRTRLHWQGARVSVLHTDFATPQTRPEGGWLPAVGDILGYLWTVVQDTVGEVITDLVWLSNGLADLVVTIGDVVWRATLAVASQAAELIDWVLQKSLGITLDDLVRWLGQVFDWAAILKAQEALKKITVLGQAYVSYWLQNEAARSVECMEAQVRSWLGNLPTQNDSSARLSSRPTDAGLGGVTETKPASLGPDMLWGQTLLTQFAGNAGFAPEVPSLLQALFDAVMHAGETLQKDAQSILAWSQDQSFDSANADTVATELMQRLGVAAIDPLFVFTKDVLPHLGEALDDLMKYTDRPLDLPVLSPMYKAYINPGQELSVLDASALLAALGGHIGSEVFLNQPLVSDEMLARIRSCHTFEELLASGATADADEVATRVYQYCQLFSGITKLGYVALWANETWGARPPAVLVRIRIALDTVSWLMSFAWGIHALAAAERLGRDKQPYTLALVFLFMAMVLHRTKDAIDFYFADKTGDDWARFKEFFGYLETVVGSLMLTVIAIWQTASTFTELPAKNCPEAEWNALKALPSVQALSNAVYYALSFERFLVESPQRTALKAVRTGTNLARALCPIANSFVVGDCVKNGWDVPGLTSD